MTKKSRQKFKYLENIQDEIKSIFHPFKGLSMKQATQFFWKVRKPDFK